MLALTISAAQKRWDEVVKRVLSGEQVILVRGARRVAYMSPLF